MSKEQDDPMEVTLPGRLMKGRQDGPQAAAAAALLASIDKLIANAPDDVEPTAEDLEAAAVARGKRAVELRQALALGTKSGWPGKYLEAVRTAPHGREWLAAYAEAEERVRMKGIVVLYGKRGCGKTRMAAELAVAVGNSRYRTAMRFFLEVRGTFRKDAVRSEMEVIDDLTECGLLILDEIQERGETGFEDRLLTHVIDARYAAMRPTVLIANLTKRELSEALGASIVDRACENGKSIEFNWESYR